jgi:hypothetical protein
MEVLYMREIKMRAWDVVTKKWITNFWLTSNGDLIYPNGGRPVIELKKDCYKLVQYTGLKDKNDKEIYEGDILTVWIGGVKQDRPEVVTSLEELYLNYNRDDSYYLFSSCEVIGSKYQNPELLEVN